MLFWRECLRKGRIGQRYFAVACQMTEIWRSCQMSVTGMGERFPTSASCRRATSSSAPDELPLHVHLRQPSWLRGGLEAAGGQSEPPSIGSRDRCETSSGQPSGRGQHSSPPIPEHRRAVSEYCPAARIPAPAALSGAWVAIRAVYRRPHPETTFPYPPIRIFQFFGLWRL